MFWRAGLENVYEMHGNLLYLQCFECQAIFKKPAGFMFDLDHERLESRTIPKCEVCWRRARPNILLWNDSTFVFDRVHQQKEKFEKFVWDQFFFDRKVVIIEVGAGTEYQAMRVESEKLLFKFGHTLAKMIRINPV